MGGFVRSASSRRGVDLVRLLCQRRAPCLVRSIPAAGLVLHNSKLYSEIPRSRRQFCEYRRYSTKPAKVLVEESTSVDEIEDIFIDIKTLLRSNDAATAKRRSLKLKSLVFDLIRLVPNEEFDHSQLVNVTEALNYLADSKHAALLPEEMLQILTSTVGSITLDDIQSCYFFPSMYKRLRNSNFYSKDITNRLQIFEIFVNYIALSSKRDHLQRLVQDFCQQNPQEEAKVAQIVLEAFSGKITADSDTLMMLFELKNLKDLEVLDDVLAMTLSALENERSNTSTDKLEIKLEKLCTSIFSKSKFLSNSGALELISVLHFASSYNCDDAAILILQKLNSLIPTITGKVRDEDLSALVAAGLKYPGFEQIVKSVIDALDRSSATLTEQLAILRFDVFTGSSVIEIESRLEPLVDEFGPETVFNSLLSACLHSSKPEEYIKELTEVFDREFNLDMNAETFSIRINNALSHGDLSAALRAFADSQANMVHWAQDSNGIYMETIFRLLSRYSEHALQDSSISVNDVFQLMIKVKSYGKNLGEAEIAPLLKLMLDNEYAGDALELLDRELPPRVGKQRLQASDYPEIFKCLHEFVLSFKGNPEVNWAVYGHIHKIFWVPFDSYLPTMKVFCEKGRPNAAHIIFNKVRLLHKEEGFPPPNEEMYEYLFKEFGRQLYEDGVFRLHLALKMDLSVNLDISLLNSLLEGYTHLQDFLKARDVFELARSLPKDRGINQETMSLMIKAMTYVNIRTVKQLWNNMSQYEVLPDSRNFEQYLIAHCYHEDYEQALQLVEEQSKEKDIEITASVLKTLHDWTIEPNMREKVVSWSEQNYPALWSGLKESGQLSNSTEYPSLIDGRLDSQIVQT
ncbi:unnamed protein product [Kuraishia capsulata CBS 1993]|uniref:Mitochondrial group I intron splicing factor CCM1 n=1 Tax=Kuraishia capsulata CBS 1993 TaxID=1382522 RepID=W6MM57_9ASCO|nr:uncharacterized protein KUCA_T00003251001 [Kuraishia capsulata CBS 1993]CDK27273.1 unnamed protein product [Kuraishia capsulata CBS 1993]